MIINPRWGVWLSIIAALGSVFVLCGAEFTTLFGSIATGKILAALGIVNAGINAANGVLHMIPAQKELTPVEAAKFALGPKASV